MRDRAYLPFENSCPSQLGSKLWTLSRKTHTYPTAFKQGKSDTVPGLDNRLSAY